MNNHKENFENLDFEVIDSLAEYLRTHAPQASILNGKRYVELYMAKEALDEVLRQSDAAPSQMKLDPMFLSGSLVAEVDDFEVHDLTLLQVAMSKADNFEIYPLVNGKMRMAFTFQRLMCAVA